MKISKHNELDVYNKSFQAALIIFELSKKFPIEEKYSLTDQIRRSSRSVCSNLAETFRKRKYPKAFIAKLKDSEGEIAETQVWLEFSYNHKNISKEKFEKLTIEYNHIIGKLVIMSNQPEKWKI